MSKKYQVIYADPPWSYNCKSPTASPGGAMGNGYSSGAEYYYPCMATKQICALPVPAIAEKDSVLFLWATNPFLPDAFSVMEEWGFKYKTLFTWHKERCKGMGYWFRGHTEHMLVGTRGKVKAFRSLQHNIKRLSVEKHSKKPDWFRELIEGVTPNQSRVELFARQANIGWDVWGHEVESTPGVDLVI